ncbi:hypothetical protein WJX75_004775 [Coccomyxa subellipsoidea]|uniref:PRISE-like Rossmann-fold domain-containing protein n=1 Tax=Coccomyxa subellipsoidea TaxID=248742 RepID=A0ABR2YFC4_9CHLO
MGKVALVTGASGIQGRSVVKKLEASNEWSKVIAVSRSPLDFESKAQRISLDLNDKGGLKSTFNSEKIKDVTHVFHLAFAGDMTNTSRTVAGWLNNLVEELESADNPLEYVFFASGNKYYGVHLAQLPGEPKTPFRETDPRHFPPNFYYDMEDYAIERKKKGAKWNWNTYRPGPIIGYSLGYMNWLMEFAVYATICKEKNLPMRYPGTPQGYRVLFDCADADLLADVQIWLSKNKHAQNTAYNVNNGDVFRFEQLWPKLAEWFGLDVAPPLHIPLTKFMPHHKDLWASIVKKYDLKDIPFEKLVRWDFAEATLNAPSDEFGDATKLRKAGFEGQKMYTEEVFHRWFKELAKMRIIPDYPNLDKKS